MGNLLGQPVTDKETHRGSIDDENVKFAVSSMQGWRVHMEDAHICQPTLYAQQIIDPISNTDNTTKEETTITESNSNDENSSTDSGQHKKAKKDQTPEKTPTSPSSNINNDSNVEDQTLLNNHAAQMPSTMAASDATQTPTKSPRTTRTIDLPGHSLFAVFDGHGGSFAAEYAGQNFCRVLACQPAFVFYAEYIQKKIKEDNSSLALTPTQQAQADREGLAALECALRDAFVEIDREIYKRVYETISNTNNNNDNANHDDGDNGSENEEEDKFNDLATTGQDGISCETNATAESGDSQILTPNHDEDSGTTAVVVLLTPQWIVCANAGDSRAVYSKNGHCTIPLSYDHKPDDEAEGQRIMDAGGYVRAGRVEGDLAVSRGLGDFRFKEPETVMAGSSFWQQQLQQQAQQDNGGTRKKKRDSSDNNNTMIAVDDQKVSPVPDIIVQNRNHDLDEFIIVACDGIWDVQTNHECVKMVEEIFSEGESDMGLLCEEILDKCLILGSKDNMTALVVKFPAQVIGEGGGVMERRIIRENTLENEEG